MKHLIFAFLALFTLFFGIQNSYSQTLNYGDEIHLQNGYDNYSGGFLDTRGTQENFEKTGNFLCVSTAIDKKRDCGSSGTWKVLSATGKAIGTPVSIGDEIHLQNGWENYTGGFLDTRGSQEEFEKTGNLYCVSTAIDKKRNGGSTGTWKVLSATGKANGTPVTQNSEVHLQNGYDNYSGGFLDIRGSQAEFEKTGNLNCVSTAIDKKRDGGISGTWKVQIIKEVIIGKQVWMTENLNVDKFSNGAIIPHAKTAEEWIKADKDKQPAWCYYNYDPANGEKYGKLYNWYAVNDPRGLAPLGYLIPTVAEWTQLTDYLGGSKVAGGKMKSTCGWKEGDNGTNESGFSGLPGGIGGNTNGKFIFTNLVTDGYWWSSTANDANQAMGYGLGYYDKDNISRKPWLKNDGLSVRCLRGSDLSR